jgi:hypothetical protein
MTPYDKNKKVIIDPTVKELRFGVVPKALYKKIGKVIERSYFKPDRCMTYLVEFPNGEQHWFKEDEIV